jgi:hypothetical protein
MQSVQLSAEQIQFIAFKTVKPSTTLNKQNHLFFKLDFNF